MGNFSTKMVSLVSVATLAVTTMGASLVAATSEFLPYAETLAGNNVIGTQSTETGYRLGDTITRAELAKVVANLGGYTPTECAGNVYGDVNSSLGDLCGFIEALADAGVVSTANANFRPSASVTRAEMVKMVLGAVGETPSDVDAGYTDVANLLDLTGYINRANELGCAATATYFRPNATASRGEAFKIASCIAYPADSGTDSTGTGTTGTGTTGTGVTTGSLTLALDGTAVAQYVPKNASSVKVGSVKLSAGDADVTVRSLVVTRSGLGDATGIVGIRAAQNGVVVSSSADYYNSTSQKGTVYFSPALVVKAGASTSVDVLANLSGSENSQHQFTLESVNSTASSVTGAPVTLGLLNTTSYSTATTTATLVASAGTVTPGKSAQSVFKVDMAAGGRDTMVTGFTLTRSGSTDFTKRLANPMVYRNGVAVGTVTMSNEKLTVSGLSDTLLAGNTQTYEIKADILVDANSSYIGAKFDSTTDVNASEVSTGYATQVTTLPATGVVVNFNSVEVTFTKLSTGSVTLAPGTNNVKLFNGKLASAVPLTVRGITITAAATGLSSTSTAVATGTGVIASTTDGTTTTTNNSTGGTVPGDTVTYTTTVNNGGISDFVNNQLSVKLNGSEIATITDLSGAQVKTVSFVVDSANPGTITVEGSIKNNTSVAGAFTFTVDLTDVRDTNNNTASIGAGKSLTGDKTTIGTAQVEVKTATVASPSTRRVYSSADQEIGRFAVTSRNEAARVQTVVLTGTTVGTGLTLEAIANSTSSVKLYNVDTNTEVSASPTISGNVITFASMNDTIAQDTTRNYKVLLSVGTVENYFGGTLTLSSPSVSAVRDTNSSSVSPTGTATLKTYTLGTTPPTVLITNVNDKVFHVKVTNTDSNTGITLTGVLLNIRTTNGGNNGSFSGSGCLRTAGSTDSCGTAGSTTPGQSVPALDLVYTLTGNLTNISLLADKNGGTVEFDVYINSPFALATGARLITEVSSITYTAGAASSTESYLGLTNATASYTQP